MGDRDERAGTPRGPGAAPGATPGRQATRNAALARQAWDAVSRSDVEALRSLWSPRLVWHANSRGTPWAGEHHSAEAAFDHLARIGESVEDFDARLDDLLVSDERFVLVFHISARRGERSLEVDYLLMARLEGDLVAEVWTAPLDPTALTTFWD